VNIRLLAPAAGMTAKTRPGRSMIHSVVVVRFIQARRCLRPAAQFSVFSFQFSVFSFQFSVFSFQFSVFSFQFSVFSFQFSVFSFQGVRRIHSLAFRLVVAANFGVKKKAPTSRSTPNRSNSASSSEFHTNAHTLNTENCTNNSHPLNSNRRRA
jgi:hypothetical protein